MVCHLQIGGAPTNSSITGVSTTDQLPLARAAIA